MSANTSTFDVKEVRDMNQTRRLKPSHLFSRANGRVSFQVLQQGKHMLYCVLDPNRTSENGFWHLSKGDPLAEKVTISGQTLQDVAEVLKKIEAQVQLMKNVVTQSAG